MGLLGLYMGKVTLVRKKLVGSSFFLKLVCPLVFSDPACAENRVSVLGGHSCRIVKSPVKSRPGDSKGPLILVFGSGESSLAKSQNQKYKSVGVY